MSIEKVLHVNAVVMRDSNIAYDRKISFYSKAKRYLKFRGFKGL